MLIMPAILANYCYHTKVTSDILVRFMKTSSVQELKTHLSNDTPDDELMRIYVLSPKQLKDLHAQLMLAMAYGSLYIHIKNDNN